MAKKASDAIVSQTGNHFYGAGGLVAIPAFFSNYVNFTGRSTRREFWWWTLWQTLLTLIFGAVVIGFIGFGTVGKDPTILFTALLGPILIALLFGLAIALPGLAIAVRRFRDAGVHWGVFVALQVAAGLVPWVLNGHTTLSSVITLAIGLVTLVIEILPTKNPPVDDADSWAEQ